MEDRFVLEWYSSAVRIHDPHVTFEPEAFGLMRKCLTSGPLIRQLPTEDNEKWLRDFADCLKLDVRIVRYQPSDLEIKHSRTRPKVLGSSPTYEIVGAHRSGVPY